MESFSVSKNDLNNLEKLWIHKDVVNTESTLYKFPNPTTDQMLILKHFFVSGDEFFDNKMAKLEKICQIDKDHVFPELVFPNGYVYVDNKLQGLTLPYIQGASLKRLLSHPDIPFKSKIHYLKEIGKLLEKMKEYRDKGQYPGFYLYDIHESNFMIDSLTNELKVVDIDGAAIDGFFPDRSMYLNYLAKRMECKDKYPITRDALYHKVVTPSDNSELYCYYMMILNLIADEKMSLIKDTQLFEYLDYLLTLGYPWEIIGNIASLYGNRDNINPYELLDMLPNNPNATYKNYLRAKRL